MALTKLNHSSMPQDSVLQAVTTTDSTRRKFTNVSHATWLTTYNNLNTSFTPLSSSSKLMFFVNIHYGTDNPTSMGSVFWRIKEGSTVHTVLNGGSSESFPSFSQGRWSHSGSGMQYGTKKASINGIQISNSSTNARIYSIEFRVQTASLDISINRDGSDNSDSNQGAHSPTLTSNITIMEIKG